MPKALLASIPLPKLNRRMSQREVIHGELSSPISPKPGCRFAVRCPERRPECTGENIPLVEIKPGHFVSCIQYAKG